MLRAMTIIETGKRTFEKGDEIVKSAFKKAELDKLIEDGIIADVEEANVKTDLQGATNTESTNTSSEDGTGEDDSKNDNSPADGEEVDTEEK